MASHAAKIDQNESDRKALHPLTEALQTFHQTSQTAVNVTVRVLKISLNLIDFCRPN